MTSHSDCERSYLFLTQSRDFRLELVKLFLQICVLWKKEESLISENYELVSYLNKYLETYTFWIAQLLFNKIFIHTTKLPLSIEHLILSRQ